MIFIDERSSLAFSAWRWTSLPATLPILAKPIFMVVGIWMIVAMVIAIRQALDYDSTARAVGVVVLGWLFQVAVLGLLLFLASGAPA